VTNKQLLTPRRHDAASLIRKNAEELDSVRIWPMIEASYRSTLLS
jgi:hypothetical protein